mmetsp:Transcript_62409/g.103809  ORF Transcript_62409/g.103809 Transcript_62409/m.103809 type:complete len:131 (+) Transcript_62409:955-1347(+)
MVKDACGVCTIHAENRGGDTRQANLHMHVMHMCGQTFEGDRYVQLPTKTCIHAGANAPARTTIRVCIRVNTRDYAHMQLANHFTPRLLPDRSPFIITSTAAAATTGHHIEWHIESLRMHIKSELNRHHLK